MSSVKPSNHSGELMQAFVGGSVSGSSASGEVGASETRAVALVSAGERLFGVPLEECREVIEAAAVTSLPGSPGWVLGLVNLRGRLLTVLDLGLWSGAEATAAASTYSVVVVEYGGRRLGLAVAGVVRLSLVAAGRGDTGRADLMPTLLRDGGADDLAQTRVCALLNLGAIFDAALA